MTPDLYTRRCTYLPALVLAFSTQLLPIAAQERRALPDYVKASNSLPTAGPSVPRDIFDRVPIAFTAPYKVIELSAAESGRVRELKIQRGSRVAKGDLLCELDVSALEARRKTAEQRAKSTAKREALEVEFTRKQRRLESLRSIASRGGGTPEEIAQAEADAKIAELNIQSADEELELARLELAEIDAQIEQRRIRAGIDGIIVDIHREAGEFVSSADPKVATLVDLSRLRATFFLPTDTATGLREGDRLPVRLLSAATTFTGEVEFVGPLTNADSGRVRVDILLENSNGLMQSGVQCTLPTVVLSSAADSRSAFGTSSSAVNALNTAPWTGDANRGTSQ